MIGWPSFLLSVATPAPAPARAAAADAGAAVHATAFIYDGALIVIGVAMLLTLGRLLRGPTLADRVVALDLLAFFAAGAIAVSAVSFQRNELLIVAVVVALLAFIGTAAFAMYLERKGRSDAE